MGTRARERKVSVKDVARLAGVSLGSVSRVINRVENVSPKVRDQVQWAMAKLEYRVNHAAQTLRSRTSRTIGCMFTDVTNPLYASLYRMFEERFRKNDYMMLLANSLNNPEREVEILFTFQSRRMDGVIVAPSEGNSSVLETLDKLELPTVILDRDIATEHDQVLFDHFKGVKDAVLHLIDLGHRDIALLVTKMPTRPMIRRIQGYRAAFAARRQKVKPNLLIRLDGATSPAAKQIEEILSQERRPTAVLALGTGILADVLFAIQAHGLRVPQDISVVSLGEPDFARNHQPPLSKVVVDLELATLEAVQLLQERIRSGRMMPSRKVMIPSSFVVGGSICRVIAKSNPSRKSNPEAGLD